MFWLATSLGALNVFSTKAIFFLLPEFAFPPRPFPLGNNIWLFFSLGDREANLLGYLPGRFILGGAAAGSEECWFLAGSWISYYPCHCDQTAEEAYEGIDFGSQFERVQPIMVGKTW